MIGMYEAVYYVTGFYLSTVFLISLYNFWRAPPPIGDRIYLVLSIALLGIGVLLDGGEKVGMVQINLEVLPETLQLGSLLLLLYVSMKIQGNVWSHRSLPALGGLSIPFFLIGWSSMFYVHAVLEFFNSFLALTIAIIWWHIYRATGTAARDMSIAVLLAVPILAFHGLEEGGLYPVVSQASMLVTSVAAASFWLNASFDIAEGRL